MNLNDSAFPCGPCANEKHELCAAEQLIFDDIFTEEAGKRNCACYRNNHGRG